MNYYDTHDPRKRELSLIAALTELTSQVARLEQALHALAEKVDDTIPVHRKHYVGPG